MTSQTTSHAAFARPLPYFIERIDKIRNRTEDPELQKLRPVLDAVHQALLVLRDCTDQLPDLSGNRWFLYFHFLPASERTLSQLKITKRLMVLLHTECRKRSDPGGLVWFSMSFIKFAWKVKASLVILQQPYQPDSILYYSDPTEQADKPPQSEPPFDWFSDDIV